MDSGSIQHWEQVITYFIDKQSFQTVHNSRAVGAEVLENTIAA